MSDNMNKAHASIPHTQAAQKVLKHIPALVAFLLIQIALRTVALIPLLLYFTGNPLFFLHPKHIFAESLLLSIPTYIVLVQPFRFHAAGFISNIVSGATHNIRITWRHYSIWLAAGCARVLYQLLWAFPAVMLTAAFYYLWNMTGFNEFGMAVNWLGGLVGGSFLEGVILYCIAYGLSLVLSAYGWWRGTFFDYLPVADVGLLRAKHHAKELLKKHSGTLARNTLINIFICAPAIFTSFAILFSRISQNLTGNMKVDISLILTIIQKAQFPAGTLEALLVTIILLYLPFVLLRKGSIAVLVANLYSLPTDPATRRIR